ncbi:leucine-rich repeat-containing protein 52 [Neophocaena asiaeorientalis asiaeorientalis]|uniref:Leucine-rich repeat-containing protein 52 n=1 Tax=Neophocaena asiaeorientalis asiaeorientalis TaxID=1706337 RepID=A0A341B7T9_NEOAA|nr:leucine-rich repeat-containing protein 52 [Neophocaena asiaeorientalis asiaeorientalis]
MSRASGPGPGWLLFSFGMGLVSGSRCPNNCQCQAQEVICTGAQLTEYPSDIPLNTRRLYLNDNSIRFLPAMNLGLLSDLVYLDCQKNLIQEVMDYTFVGVFKLIYLDLSFNNLTLICPYSFSMLSNLVQLNISSNPHLLSLNKYTFANTSSLRYLDLRNTGLQTLDHAAFHNLITLQTLYLSGNPWKCNCSFLDFTIYLIMSPLNHPDEQNATCLEPTELAGWPITKVGNPLRYMCVTHLDHQDYIFLLLIGFCIFSAGTVAAWLTGMCAVLYQNARRRSSEDEAEDELGQSVEASRRIFQSRVESGQDGFPQLI